MTIQNTDFVRTACVTVNDSDRDIVMSTSRKPSFNANFRILLRRYRKILEASTEELRDLFSPEEWLYLAATMRNQEPAEMFICDKGAFISYVMSYKRKGVQKMYAVDMNRLTDKLNTLHAANITALYMRLLDYDRHIDKIDKEAWSRF